MKAFSYDPVRNSIFIEPGVLLGEVYDGLQSQGVAPVGGRVESVYSFLYSTFCLPRKVTSSLRTPAPLVFLALLSVVV
jgi:hypothetical protein